MSRLRPECGTSNKPALNDRQVYWHIYRAISKRRALAYGKLHDKDTGRSCAMGAMWDENSGIVVNTCLTDRVAAVNDSVPPTATDNERWRHVMRWLRAELGL